ncbi:MAG: hypothetical protein FJ386_11235 [Verrucomicrobia bacterium]|nr:hypothetical protein [Verrucomicrobiota bacterium]
MQDLTNPKLIWLKGILFLAPGIAPAALLIAEVPTGKVALLLELAVWSFCRACYFAFYVVGRYVDPSFRFSGLFSFVRYALARRRGPTP